MVRYCTARRDQLVTAGYIPLPIKPGDKAPAVAKWSQPSYVPPAGHTGCGIGLICGRGDYPIAAIDIDVTDEELAAAMCNKVRTMMGGEILYRVGNPPKRLVVCRYDHAGVLKKSSARYSCGGIEALGSGQQFVAFGLHPGKGRDYYWHGGRSIFDVKAADLPVITEAQIQELFALFEEIAAARGFALVDGKSGKDRLPEKNREKYDPTDPLDVPSPVGLDLDGARELLAEIDPDSRRRIWVEAGMALHQEYGGAAEALKLWDEWSAKGRKYKPGEPAKQWGSFGNFGDRPITARSLIMRARQEKEAKENGGDTNINKNIDPNKKAKGDQAAATFFDNLDWSVRRFEGDAPPLENVIEDFLPKGFVTTIYSAGGTGKSTLAMNMAVKIAAADGWDDVDFLGHKVNGGAVVILTAEDPEVILHRRFRATVDVVAAEIGISREEAFERVAKNLSIVNTFEYSVQLFTLDGFLNTTLKVTPYYTSFLELLKQIKNLQLVIIDTKSQYSPAEGKGNVIVTQEMTHYRMMTKETGASVMLLHHTSKASRDGSQTGAQAFRDETALFDGVRAAWYLRSCKTSELQSSGIDDSTSGKYLFLENSKNNNMLLNEPVILERDGYKFTPRRYVSKAPASDGDAKERKQDKAGDKIIEVLADAPQPQAGIVRLCKDAGFVRSLALGALEALIADGLVDKRGEGRSVMHYLTDEGRKRRDTALTESGP